MSVEDAPPLEEGEPEPESEEEQPQAEEASRRKFIRQAAEVAAFSLFGLGALDPLIERVLLRVGELTGMEQLAESVAGYLRESGVIGVAEARPPNDRCLPAEGYECHDFQCMLEFRCPWPSSFFCSWGTNFICWTTFKCELWSGGVAWFACDTKVDFICNWDQQFTCGGSPEGFLCPGSGQFYPGCTGYWACNQTGEFHECVRPGAEGFECATVGYPGNYDCTSEAEAGFECRERTHHFICGSEDFKFSCDDTTTYDFRCMYVDFTCGTGGVGRFECSSNHLFHCHEGTNSFTCAGDAFKCTAGGNHCGVGATGRYDFDRPGDFACWEFDREFICARSFSCHTADDFQCGASIYQCTAPFQGCDPTPQGHFECSRTYPPSEWGFQCIQQGEQAFECNEPWPFSRFDV